AAAKNIISEAAALGLGRHKSLSAVPTSHEAASDEAAHGTEVSTADLNELIGAAANTPEFSSNTIAENILAQVDNRPASSPAETSFGSRNGDSAAAAAPAQTPVPAPPRPVQKAN